MKLVLFDIDMTLISTGGAGRRAMVQAFQDLFQRKNGFDKISFAGRTDSGILYDALFAIGESWSEEKEEAFKSQYFDYLGHELNIDSKKKRIQPGVVPILDELSGKSTVMLGLLTGNWRTGAKLKLQHFGLWNYFKLGAFSDDSKDRNNLARVAAKRFFDLTGTQIIPDNMFIIGDTPKDVECAKPFGATSVAVATGSYSAHELAKGNPAHLFDDLSNTESVLELFL